MQARRLHRVREKERVVGVGFGFVKEFSAPLLTLTKCFWPPQLQQAPPPHTAPLSPAQPQPLVVWLPPAPAAPFWLGSCQLICIIALYLFAAPSLRSCCSPTQLGLAHSLSLTHTLPLFHTGCSVSVARVVVCVHFSLGFSWHFCGLLSG